MGFKDRHKMPFSIKRFISHITTWLCLFAAMFCRHHFKICCSFYKSTWSYHNNGLSWPRGSNHVSRISQMVHTRKRRRVWTMKVPHITNSYRSCHGTRYHWTKYGWKSVGYLNWSQCCLKDYDNDINSRCDILQLCTFTCVASHCQTSYSTGL